MKVKLGDLVTDRITGFTGIAVGRAEYLNGCISIEVQPQALHDGKPIAPEWIDEQRLVEGSEARAGGPQDRPPALPPRPLEER